MAAPSCYKRRMKDESLSPKFDKRDVYSDGRKLLGGTVKAAVKMRADLGKRAALRTLHGGVR